MITFISVLSRSTLLNLFRQVFGFVLGVLFLLKRQFFFSIFYLCSTIVHWMHQHFRYDFFLFYIHYFAVAKSQLLTGGAVLFLMFFDKCMNVLWKLRTFLVSFSTLRNFFFGHKKRIMDDGYNNGIVHAFGDGTQVITQSWNTKFSICSSQVKRKPKKERSQGKKHQRKTTYSS